MWKYIKDNKSRYGENIPALSPIYNKTEEMIKAIAKELGEAFDSEYVHIGGDEVNVKAWKNSSEENEIQKFMEEKNFSSYMDLEGYFSKIAQKEILDNNKKPVVYSEIYSHGYAENKSNIIHIWTDGTILNETLKKGYKIIASVAFYLDVQMPTCKSYKPHSCDITHNRFAYTYKDMYNWEPLNEIDKNLIDGVLGFEACSWNESCDRQNVFNRVFQRYFAVAERMWSSEEMKVPESVEIRGSHFRCIGLRRDILTGAGPINPSLCDLKNKTNENI